MDRGRSSLWAAWTPRLSAYLISARSPCSGNSSAERKRPAPRRYNMAYAADASIVVSYETVRRWAKKFGRDYARPNFIAQRRTVS